MMNYSQNTFSCDEIDLSSFRSYGVVGYHVCFTRRRSPKSKCCYQQAEWPSGLRRQTQVHNLCRFYIIAEYSDLVIEAWVQIPLPSILFDGFHIF
uniref:Uncharacterized protein n=1 Tax=Strongyloides venezuelensis TaxID=75913 RepID=A0A0K0G5H0_STRVS